MDNYEKEIDQRVDIEFEDMIRQRTSGWAEDYDANNRTRIAEGVTMTMRKRGDNFGYFHQTRAKSLWQSIFGKSLVTYPVIERAIRSKTATSVSTRIRITVEPVIKTPEKEAAAEICNSIFKFFDSNLWTNRTEAVISELCQLMRFCFVYNNYANAGGLKVDIPVTEQKKLKTGTTDYVCSTCGNEFGPEDIAVDDPADAHEEELLEMQDAPDPERDNERAEMYERELPNCPDCGGQLHLTSVAKIELINSITGEFVKKETGKMEMKIVSPLLLRLDTKNTHGFDYKKAHWFNFHPIVPLYQLLKIAPHLKEKILNSNFSRWSDGARWYDDLGQGSDISGSNVTRSSGYYLDEEVEVNFWWITPQACFGWKSPSDYKCEGFSIKKGESIEKACVRQFGAFDGLLVITVDDEVIPIGTQDFCEGWVGFPWKIDAQSLFPQGEENLLASQDSVTRLLSMINAFCGRFGNPKLIVNSLKFGNSSSFEKNFAGQVIYTNNADPETVDEDYRKNIGYLQPADMSAAVYNFVQMIIDIAKETSGIFNETVGNVGTSTETLGGREMALNQSLGLMTPTQQAKAFAIVELAYCWIKLVQKYAPDEAFILFKGTFNEEFKADDIRILRETDIDNEMLIKIVQGTDIPKTQLEMEQKFIAAMNFGLFMEPNQMPLEIRNYVIKQVLGIDYDIGNFSASKRIAARRFDVIKEELAMFAPQDALTVIEDASGFPVESLRPEIISSIQQDPRTKIRDTDDHLSMIGYWTDELNGQIGAKDQDVVLTYAIELMITMHRAALAGAMAQAQAAQGVADNAPNKVAESQDMANQPMLTE